VSETVDKEGNRIYQILRLFSKDFSAAAHDFIQKTEIGFGPRTKEIWGLIIEARDFDFAHATDQSRIVVHVTYAENKSDRLLAFRGSGLNCDHILMLCRKYFFQQFVSPAAQVDA
jgi:hypothetical protein